MTAAVAARPSLPGTVPPMARPAESRLALTLRTARSTSMTKTLMRTVPIDFAAASATSRLSNREIRRFALRRLAIGAGQCRPDQATMNRTLVVDLLSGGQRQRFGFCSLGRSLERGGRFWSLRNVDDRFNGVGAEFGTQRAFHRLTGCTFGAPAALRRNTRPLELMVRLAGSAACLLDLIFDHGHDGVVGDAALARAVIVQNVTEPKPALLH